MQWSIQSDNWSTVVWNMGNSILTMLMDKYHRCYVTNKIDCHDIAVILMEVALNTT